MVLLFWAHLLSSTAEASAGNFMWCDAATGECEYYPPPTESGPVIEKLRKHYCTGSGHPLLLDRSEVYTPALVKEMKTRAAWHADGWIYIGWQDVWNDNTIFADMPYNYDLWMKTGVFAGEMGNNMAKLLGVISCPSGRKPIRYYVSSVD